MSENHLTALRDLIQEDPGERGLRTDPADNLISACPTDFAAACKSLAETPRAKVIVVTGFYIAHAEPPCAETDGPLGAIFLARALLPLGIEVLLATDGFCVGALQAGLQACGLRERVPILNLDSELPACMRSGPTHLIALERVGPSHTRTSVRGQAGATDAECAAFEQRVRLNQRDRCYSMSGRDLTACTGPAHLLFEVAAIARPSITTIGIGDGGNEIGMGKIRWGVIQRNIAGGGLIACRIPTDYLIVCGVSNWGAYALAAGTRKLRNAPRDVELFDVERERELLEIMVRDGPLVDGRTGARTATVDGLTFDRYAAVLRQMGEL